MPRGAIRFTAIGVFAGLCVLDGSATAAPTPADRVLAESLFQEARDLMNADKVSEACAKFAESYRLDSTLGTLLNLAVCHEKEGRVASAWAEFTDAAEIARANHQSDRETMAMRHVEALRGQLSFVVFVVPETAPPGLEIALDGTVIRKAAWSSKLPIDPGAHRIEARAPKKQSWTREIVVASGANELSVDIPALEDAPDAPAPPPAAPPVVAAPDRPEPPPPAAPSSSLATIGWITGGVGVVAIGVGTFFGIRTLSLKSDRDAHCGAGNVCDADGVGFDKDARTAATISTITVAAGAALVAAGVVLVIVAPSARSRATIDLRMTGTGAAVGGRW